MPIAADASESIADQTARGFRTMLQSHAVRVLCKVASVPLLARLVSPADQGLYAMAASLTLLLTVFRDFGLGTAAVRAPRLSEDERNVLCWAHIAIGGVLCVATLALTPVLVSFYQKPQLAPLLALMSVSFVFLGINTWPRVLLARDLHFTTLNRLETVAVLVATTVLLSAGAAGAGAYAFAGFLLAFEGCLMLTVWRACPWRPKGRPQWRQLGPMLRTGAGLTGYGLVMHVSSQVDIFAVGRWFGSSTLGLYNRSAQLLLLPTQHIVTPLSQVLLAGLSREDHASADFRAQLRSTTNLTLHLTLPLAAICIALPFDMTRLVLGPTWLEAAPLLRWLAIGAVFSTMGSTLYPLGVALGRTSRLVMLALLSLFTSVAALLLARDWGAVGIARALAVSSALLLVPRLWWITHGSAVRLTDYISSFASPVAVAAALTSGIGLGRQLVPSSPWFARVACGLAGGLVCVGLLYLMWPRLRREWKHGWAHRPRLAALSSSGPITEEAP